MRIEDSTNGYCNLWVIGKNAVGKTSLIKKLFDDENDSSFISTNNYEIRTTLISDGEHNVKLNINEIHSLNEINLYNKFESHVTSIFLLLTEPNIYRNVKFEKEIIQTIEDTIPNSLIFFLIKDNSPITVLTPPLNSKIRDVFDVTDLNSDEFICFKNILKNTILNSSTNRLRKVKHMISNSVNSLDRELDLGKCNLMSLYEIPELFDCLHLETLILSNEWAEYENGKWKRIKSRNSGGNNNLGFIPNEIKKLKNLKKIILGGDWNLDENIWERWRIKNITPLSKLTKLQYLNVSNNLVMAIPNFTKLPLLSTLHLNNNQITRVYFDGEFKNLKELYLSNNFLKTIVFFNKTKFRKISTLDLHGNNIIDLEPLKNLIQVADISNSSWRQNTINIAKNPLQKPPMEIVNIGKTAVLNYFKELSSGKSFINKDIKVILVGNSEVGKTTLAKYLDDEKDLDKEHYSTLWMEEKQVSSKYILETIKQKCTINLFDFGGHDYFHDTHHLFFSSNTIYILLWDDNSNCLQKRRIIQKNSKGVEKEVEFQDFPLKYWLESIKHFIIEDNKVENFDFEIERKNNYNSAVLVLQNKVYNQDNLIFLNNKVLKEDYPFIYDFIGVSIKEKRKLNHFDEVFLEILNNTPFIGARILDYFGKVKNAIKEYDGKPIINTKEFLIFCNSIKGVDISLEQSKVLANYLNQVGVILHHPYSANKDTIYINKSWVIEKIHVILENLYEKNGEFNESYLADVFENTLNNNQKESILKLMIDFKIIFKHPYSNLFIAPLYLPKKPINLVNLFVDENKLPYRRFIYKGFIFKNVILNFFQEYGKYVINDNSLKKNYYYWRDGLIIKNPQKNEIIKIQFFIGDEDGNAHIDIYKITNTPETNFIKEIIKYINNVNKEYEIEETVTIDGIDFISYELINKNAKEGRLIFTEKSINEKQNKKNTLEQKVFELKKYAMFIEEGIKKKKVVISYSKKDLVKVHTFVRYLKPLVDLELIEQPWYCTLINPAEEWDDKIQSKFNDADIIFFMISEYFYSTQYIIDKEIKNAIERYDNNKSVKIVPIILEHYEWERKAPYNLKRFSALPYQAKPISDFKNDKIAWNTITASVRVMIEKDLDPGKIELISRDLQEIYERQVEGKLDYNSH
jgi:GTPase SAR1 family protein